MQYKNSFNLYACFIMVFILETASERRQNEICVPCSQLNERNICGSNKTDVCIADEKQLKQVLKKIISGQTADESRQTEQVTRQTEQVTHQTEQVTHQTEQEQVSRQTEQVTPQTEQVTRQKKLPESENVKESRTKDFRDNLAFYIVLLGILSGVYIMIFLLCITRKRRQCVGCMTRNISDHQNKTTKLLLRESNKCDGPELSIRRSFFKKSIDATLSRSELEKLKKCMQSVGILFWNKTGQGTVIRIGIKHILTAWHVIEPIVSTPGRVDHHGKAINSMNVEALKNKDTVCVDFSEDTRNGESHCQFRLSPKICFFDKNLDVCVLEVNGEVRDLPKPINLFRDFIAMKIGSTHKFVHVIGQHPETPNIVVDPGCKIILHDDMKVKQAKKWIKDHKHEILRHNDMERDLQQTYKEVIGTREHLILDTFLEFGASGGAVLSFTPDGEVALVAILMRGLPSWFWTDGSRERGFQPIVRMEVACLITEILSSKKWRDSEKERIFGQSGHVGSTDYTGDNMETDQNARGAFDVFGVTTHDTYADGNAMETDQLERDAVDNKMSQISLKETC